MAQVRIEALEPADADAVFALLTNSRLPLDGLAGHLETTLVARDGDRVVGSAALELYDDGALLRSVAVAEEWRGRDIGRRLKIAGLRFGAGRGSEVVLHLSADA